MGRERLIWLTAAVAWTLFVWLGRMRNALEDMSTDSRDLLGAMLLSASFVAGSLTVAWLAWRGRAARPGIGLVRVVWLLAAWSTVVWASRITDIAMVGDHTIGFVAVHAVIGLLSVMLWTITACSIVERHSGESASIG